MTTLREAAYHNFISLRPRERAILRKRFAHVPSTIARMDHFERVERGEEPLQMPEGFEST